MTVITIGSLFAGISGMGLGIEAALQDEGFDVKTTFQVERDPYCLAVLARHYPDTTRVDDVRRAGAIPCAYYLPGVDVLEGGSPCQQLSMAGRRTGLAGEQSGLWREQARIIDELRPRVIVWENVPGARSPVRERSSRRVIEQAALATVLCDVSAVGYDAVWFSVGVSDVGGPHERERIFVVGWRRDLVADSNEQRIGGVEERNLDTPGEQPASLRPHTARRGDSGGCRSDHGRGRTVGARGETQAELALSGGEGLPRPERVQPEGSDGLDSGGAAPEFHSAPRRAEGISLAGMGRDAHGIPAGVDARSDRPDDEPPSSSASGGRYNVADHRWPSRPGEPQFEYEPPRITTERQFRRPRLKALGNACSPPQGYVAGKVVAWALRLTARVVKQ